jgi:ABC-type lipoprotein release transport system permease subunit
MHTYWGGYINFRAVGGLQNFYATSIGLGIVVLILVVVVGLWQGIQEKIESQTLRARYRVHEHHNNIHLLYTKDGDCWPSKKFYLRFNLKP